MRIKKIIKGKWDGPTVPFQFWDANAMYNDNMSFSEGQAEIWHLKFLNHLKPTVFIPATDAGHGKHQLESFREIPPAR